jgi:hypothetical protein
MSKISPGTRISGFTNFPTQKLSDKKKTDKWYKDCIDFAENILVSDHDLRNHFNNKRINYNLRANRINPKDFKKFINPDNLDLERLPAQFQHVGIENSKINLLLGEYSKRKKSFRAYLSANDNEGISRKEQTLKAQMDQLATSIIMGTAQSEEEIEKKLREFQEYARYDFQDVAEITANKILKREYKEQNFDFLFLRTFEDLLVAGEQIVYCGVLGGEPVIRRVNPMNLYTLGGHSMYTEDSDVIVWYDYLSVGQVIDDYWDELTPADVDFLETGTRNTSSASVLGLNRDVSIFDRYGEEETLQIFHPNELGTRTFAGAFDTYGNVRVVRTCWKSRRKIFKRKYYDDFGEEQYDYVDENYTAKKHLGEEIEEIWVNEWLEGTKIADDIYVGMHPVRYSGKSLTNKSKGTPPFVGTAHSTNDYRVQSLTDVMKPLAYSYDIAYYKRELEIATYKGNFAAINASMIPAGWKPEEWIRYITVNKFGFLDPTNEILKGPSQGKSAGAFNTLTATNVQIGDPQAIQMYTNLLVDIENTLGKLAGVSGAREGQIQNREAVGNVEREVAQTSHITEKWFAVDSNFRKRVLEKFLDVAKFAYKKYPKRGQYILDDMGSIMIQHFDEFAASEMDIHIGNATEDTQLFNEIKSLSQAAIQNGQAKIEDLISISTSESVQETSRKLKTSAERIREEQNERAQMDRESNEKIQAMKNEIQEKSWQRDDFHKNEDRKLEYVKIDQKREEVLIKEQGNNFRDTMRIDSDGNGIADELDILRTEVDRQYKEDSIKVQENKLEEDIRKNKEKEKIEKEKVEISKKNQTKKS